MSQMRIQQVFLCKGQCGKSLVSEGYCRRCFDEIEALCGIWEAARHAQPRRKPMSTFQFAGTITTIGVWLYVSYHFAVMFAAWIIQGGN